MIDALDQVSLNEIARMAWGSGSREGAAGGRGKIGVLVDANGKSRIIKYDTHLFSRSTADKNDRSQLDAANNLRRQLLSIANRNLNLEVCEEIRAKLGLDRCGTDYTGTDLLDRTVVAQVVAMIDSQIWEKAFADKDQSDYRTKNVTTSYEAVVRGQSGESPASHEYLDVDAADRYRKSEEVANRLAENFVSSLNADDSNGSDLPASSQKPDPVIANLAIADVGSDDEDPASAAKTAIMAALKNPKMRILTVGGNSYYHASGVPDDVLEGSAIEILDWFAASNFTPQQTLKWAKLLSRQHADLLSDEDKAFEGHEYKVELKFNPTSRHVVCTVDAAMQRFRKGSYSDVVTENRTFTYSEKAGDKE